MYSAIYRDIVKQLSILSLCLQSDNKAINEVHIDVDLSLRNIAKLKKEDPEGRSHLKAFYEEAKLDANDETNCFFRGHSLQSNPSVKALFLKNTLNVLDAITNCLNKCFCSFLLLKTST